MNLCSDGHEEVCFDARKCPVCEIISEKDGKIDELDNEIVELKAEVKDLENSQ